MLLEIRKYSEFELTPDIQHQIALLLQKCFPETNYHGKHYLKQLPHYRLLAYEDEMLIGQVGIDYRIMRLNDQAIHVFGVVDLCVIEENRNHYIGSFLLEEVEKLADTLALGISHIVYLVNPEIIVLGGGIMAREDILRPLIEKNLKKYLIKSVYYNTRLDFAKLKNRAGMIGAFCDFKRRYIKFVFFP